MLKLYAIRDRLVDYYMQPFVAHSDPQVVASISNIINNEESSNVVAKAPHHFEIWRLAEIDERTGQVQGDREFLADCGSLLRPAGELRGDLRPRGVTGPGALQGAPGGERGEAAATAHREDAGQRAPQSATQAENRPGAEIDPRPDGTT